jgi:hypothetical protein
MATNPWFASRTLAFVEGDRTLKMNRARRAIGFSVLVMLDAPGVGYGVDGREGDPWLSCAWRSRDPWLSFEGRDR